MRRLSYFERRLHIPVAKIFSWAHFEEPVSQRLRGWDSQKLRQIYADRHEIVPRDRTPIQSRAELDQIQDFFSKMVLNVAAVAKEKYPRVWSDMERTVAATELYPRLKAEMEKGSQS